MILRRLEELPVSSFHYKLLGVAGLGWMFDSFDTGLIAFVLPVLAKEWHLAPPQMGLIGSIGLAGMALGAVVSGTMADRWGRKNVFSFTILLYSLATGLCAWAPTYHSLLLCRFLVGFGLGGELPVAVTLVSEYAPARVRGRFIVLLESFWAVGWIGAACIAYLFIPHYGWRLTFLIGAIPALYIFIIRLHMPESVRYLLSKGKREAAEQIVSTLETALHEERTTGMTDAEADVPEVKQSFRTLWSPSYRVRTILLWLVWFGIIFSYYGIFMWLPSFVFKQGFAVIKTFEYVLMMTLAQLPGYFSAAYLVERWGRKYTLAIYLLGSGIAGYFFGHAGSVAALISAGAIMSFFNLGAWGVLYTYTPEQYPTAIRAMGSGWAAGFGRIGGIVAPLLVGYLLSESVGMNGVFYLFAAVFCIIAALILLLGRESKKKALEDLA